MPLGTTAGTGKDIGGDVRWELGQEITALSDKIKEIRTDLLRVDTQAENKRAFEAHALYFTKEIMIRFMNYADKKGNRYYQFLNSGEGQKVAVKRIIDSATKVAELFERYSKKPTSYSRAKCVRYIHDLLIKLDNLKFYCQQ